VAASGGLNVESKTNETSTLALNPSELVVASHFYYLYEDPKTSALDLCTGPTANECVEKNLVYYKKVALGTGIAMLIYSIGSILAKIFMIILAVVSYFLIIILVV